MDPRGSLLSARPYPPRVPSFAAAAVALLVLGGLSSCSVSVGGGGGDADGVVAEGSEVIGDANEGIEGVQSIRVGDNTHTEGTVDYALRPPAGGAHHPTWLNCGFYDEAFPDEHIVHDLEHGAVWLAYADDLSDDDADLLHELVRGSDKVVATPYADLPADVAVVATAWARQLRVESAADDRLEAFIARYADGDQAPEAGVPCGGTPLGEPLP